MIRALLVLAIVISVYSCEKSSSLTGLRGSGIEFNHGGNSRLIELLEESNILYELENGAIYYMQRDTAEVRKLIRLVRNGGEINNYDIESEIAVNERHLQIYKRRFEAASIPYEVKKIGDYYSISWRLKYADKADQIIEDAGFEYHDFDSVN
jgi:hypothetical protein